MAHIGKVEVRAVIHPKDDGPDLDILYKTLNITAEWQQAELYMAVAHCLKFADEVVEVKITKKREEDR